MKIEARDERDEAFMEAIKGAIADRNATLDEVIALVRKSEDVAGWCHGWELIQSIEELKS